MAPSQGPQLVSALWKQTRLFLTQAAEVVKARAPFLRSAPTPQLQPIYEYIPRQQALNRVWQARQAQRRFFSTAKASARRVGDAYRASRTASQFNRAAFAKPFASTLRPNLTGGALPRSAGGYALSGRVGGARHFSHGAARPADVIYNVSAGMRAFWLSGSQFKTNRLEEKVRAKRSQIESKKKTSSVQKVYPPVSGSYIDFNVSPTLSAFGCLSAFEAPKSTAEGLEPLTLNAENFMNVLTVDFVRAVKELNIIHADIKRLSAIGDLPIKLINSTTLRVCFPGYEQEVVERLCADLGVMRGIIGQDEDFEVANGSDMALQFPFAPTACSSEMSVGDAPALTDMSASLSEELAWQSVASQSAARYTPDRSIFAYDMMSMPDTNPWAESDSDSASITAEDYMALTAVESAGSSSRLSASWV